MERNLHKRNKTRPELIIETREESIEEKSFKRKPSYKNEVEIKPLMSAKNRHELKNVFQFPVAEQHPFQFKEKQENKLKALERLETEKVELMKSLEILKEGAVSAIVEKEEEIQRLKEQMYASSLTEIKNMEKSEEQELNKSLYEKELELKESYQKELEAEVEELRRELRKERIRYESELYEKEEIINSLYAELNDSFHKIEEYEKHDEYLNEKLKNVELENLSLLKELETSHNLNSSQRLNSSFFLNISNVTNKSRNKSLPSEDAFFEQTQTIGDLSYASTVPIKRYSEMSNEDEDQLENSFISQRIEAIRERHKQEIEEIKEQYEIEIKKLKKQYENKDKEKRLNENKSQETLKRIGSSESLQSITYGQKEEDSKRLHRYKTKGSLNLIRSEAHQYSMEGIPIQENMESIMERCEYDEAGTPRNHFSLKQEILDEEMYSGQRHSPNHDTVTTISNLHNYFNNQNSSQKYLLNYDTISQFTANHFEYPFNTLVEKTDKPFQRTNSVATFEAEADDVKTKKIGSVEERLGSYNIPDKVIEKSPSKFLSSQTSELQHITYQSECSDEDDRISSKSNHSEKSNKSSIKKDIMLFCVGLVTGGTLLSVSKRFFNK